MGKIAVLSENLSNKIAAGEVVERPASVVKELVENAIDADSSRIFVSILEGGTELIQVVDDGEGMTQDEALLAFRRHATSKISNEADLASIGTLGFRGEALPSIASIAQVRLRTRIENAAEGSEILISGGEVLEVKAIGLPRGSSFEVRKLFYNVPARKKFLKTRQTELGHISRLLSDLALSHEGIHFRLAHGGRVLLDVPACRSLKERVFQLFGEKILSQSMRASGEIPGLMGLSLEAFLSRPPLKKNFRKEQRIFVNCRPVKSALLHHAIYNAYSTALMKGEAPFFVLFLKIDPEEVDVNVHPTKSEVRFRDTGAVHQAVKKMIQESISLEQETFLKTGLSQTTTKDAPLREKERGTPASYRGGSQSRWPGWPNLTRNESQKTNVREGTEIYTRETGFFTGTEGVRHDEGKDNESPSSLLSETPIIRALGQVYGTFLLAEIDGVFMMVDQHTAHERILYEEILEAWNECMSHSDNQKNTLEIQPFLIPQHIDLPIEKGAVLKEHLSILSGIGCKIESFGETNFIVREMPALLIGMHLESFLHELCDDLTECGLSSTQAEEPFRTIIASMACHGAIRANQKMSLPEIEALLLKYFQRNTPLTCPHGRPVVQAYPMSDLEKRFRRK